ncbi:MAG: hypothetical protein AAFR23_00550 [Pseudomonadota bacterium]
MRRAIARTFGTTGIMAGLGICMLMVSVSGASAQQLSEKAVRTFMDYAWSLTPKKFTKPDGTSILIDRTKRSEVEVPLKDARSVIMAGRMTAHAQICELQQHQVANYQSMMRRERGSARWSDQQMVYINQLHLTTVMLLTGQIGVKSKDGDGKDVEVRSKKPPVVTCTPEQRTKVKQVVEEYVKSEPKFEKKQTKKTSG